MPEVFVATGAFDCGKTTTLEWLREHHGVRIHAEAHLLALARLGGRTAGHPPGQPFSPISEALDPDHFCPMCRPWEFAELVLDEQRNIELAAQPGDLLERGFLDPIEMLLRRTGAREHPTWRPIARYVRVLSFDVMPQLQAPRWGTSAKQRAHDAIAINERLDRMYRAAGFEVVHIEPGGVEARAAQVLAYMRV